MYDLIFLGGGPGGYEGAISAGKRGLKCAVIEMDKLGGACLQRGCIPTKTLLNSVKIIKSFKNAKKLGINIKEYEIDPENMAKQKERVVSKLTKGIEFLFSSSGVDLIKGRGKIIAPGKIRVDEKEVYEAKNIVISTGSVPAQLPFLKFDGKFIISSDDALELNDIPEKLLIIGAGAIGVEMGVIYSYLGSRVTIVEIMDQIIPGSDLEISGMLKNELKKDKIKILTSTSANDPVIDVNSGEITFSLKDSDKKWIESFTKVLLSVGRSPNTEDIFDASMNIKLDGQGFIKVDKNMRTGVPGIFACGDVIGHPLLAHKASHQAVALVDYIINKKDINDLTIPAAVFTFPEFASVGITEEEAKKTEKTYKVGKFPYSAGSRSNAVDEKAGIVKIISDGDNRLLGAHILGAEAGELIPVLTYGVSKGIKAEEFRDLVFIHPTLSENVWEALGEISGFSIHI